MTSAILPALNSTVSYTANSGRTSNYLVVEYGLQIVNSQGSPFTIAAPTPVPAIGADVEYTTKRGKKLQTKVQGYRLRLRPQGATVGGFWAEVSRCCVVSATTVPGPQVPTSPMSPVAGSGVNGSNGHTKCVNRTTRKEAAQSGSDSTKASATRPGATTVPNTTTPEVRNEKLVADSRDALRSALTALANGNTGSALQSAKLCVAFLSAITVPVETPKPAPVVPPASPVHAPVPVVNVPVPSAAQTTAPAAKPVPATSAAKPTCAAKKADGTACGNRPVKGQETCRHHTAAKPVAQTFSPSVTTGKPAPTVTGLVLQLSDGSYRPVSQLRCPDRS